MKRSSLFSLMTSLAILSVGTLTRNQSAMAEPASIFRPLLRDIQAQLPRDMVMRLPASIPYRSLPPANSNNTLYPYLYSKNGELDVEQIPVLRVNFLRQTQTHAWPS